MDEIKPAVEETYVFEFQDLNTNLYLDFNAGNKIFWFLFS